MKKIHYLWIFIATFLIMTFLLRNDLITICQYYKISNAPAQTVVTKTNLISEGTGSTQSYHVEFTYQIDGKDYRFKSLNTNKKAANNYLTDDKYKHITYAQNAPNIAMLTEHYQLRQKEHPAQIIITILLTNTIAALILTVILALFIFLIRKAILKK